jgi:hypothetical protein
MRTGGGSFDADMDTEQRRAEHCKWPFYIALLKLVGVI